MEDTASIIDVPAAKCKHISDGVSRSAGVCRINGGFIIRCRRRRKGPGKRLQGQQGQARTIVIFEKKIDGSHIIVEAVCDTKKGQNFMVSEYLSSVGVDQNEVVKALQTPMDAASDPRHTSETLAADPPADLTVPQQAGQVNENRVENSGANKNAADSAAAAEGGKYNLPEMASETEEKTKRQMALTIRPAQQNVQRTAKVSGENWSGMKTQDVYKAIRNILTEFGIRDKIFRMEDLDVEFEYGSNSIREKDAGPAEEDGKVRPVDKRI